ncbi:MAG TPA: class I SAM-dependent methyltransferase [Acidimicrobiales bacterium]
MTTRWQDTPAPRGDAYQARFDALAAAGHNPHGEVDFVQRYAPESVLDAGCGTGRVAIELVRRGVHAVGVDLDPEMLATARRNGPGIEWYEADLATLDLRDERGERRRFSVVVTAGNVMIFLRPGTEHGVVARLADHLQPGGRLISGFQLQPSRLSLEEYDRAAADAGLQLEARYSTWDGDPFVAPGSYAVSVHRRP